MRTKILYLAGTYTHLAHFHIPVLEMLKKKGWEIHLCAGCDCDIAVRKKEYLKLAYNFKTFEIPFPRSLSPFKLARAYFLLRRLLDKENYSIVHTHTPIASWLVRRAVSGMRPDFRPLVIYTAHGFHYTGSRGRDFLFRKAESTAGRWTDALVVINKEDYVAALEMGFVPSLNLFFVPGVGVQQPYRPISRFSRRLGIRRLLGIPDDSFAAVCAAEFSPVKNHDFLLRVWKDVEERLDNAYLLLLGWGRKEMEVKRTAKKLKLRSALFVGYQENVFPFLYASDVFLLFSKREGLPLALLEAQACGLPAVVSDVRGCRDVVEDGKNGFVVNDEGEAVERIVLLAEDRDLRARMGRLGRRRAEGFSLPLVINRIKEVYRNAQRGSFARQKTGSAFYLAQA